MTEKTNNPCLIVGCSDRVWRREFQNRFHLEIIVKNVKFFKIMVIMKNKRFITTNNITINMADPKKKFTTFLPTSVNMTEIIT